MRRSSAGFTLLELLVAAALSAVLMACVLAVIGTLAHDRTRMSAAPDERAALLDLVRLDLAQARQLTCDADGTRVTLTGPLGLDPVTLTPTGRLATVTYEVVTPAAPNSQANVEPLTAIAKTDGPAWLVRRQRLLDDPRSSGATWSELVATAAASFTMTAEAPTPMGTVPPKASNTSGAGSTTRPTTLGRVRVRMTWQDPKRAPINAVVVSW